VPIGPLALGAGPFFSVQGAKKSGDRVHAMTGLMVISVLQAARDSWTCQGGLAGVRV